MSQPNMRNIGIAVDNWKVEIFRKHLKQNSFVYQRFPGVTPGTTMFKVKADDFNRIKNTVHAANAECDAMRQSASAARH